VSEFTERVARAIFAEFDEITEPDERDDCLGIARDAIAAMRKPTEAMLIVGVGSMAVFADYPNGDMTFKKLWNSIIDEALK
jgi:hypothetical protein